MKWVEKRTPVVNIHISLPSSADSGKFGFLDDLLGDFVMLRNGMLKRGHDARLKTAYADIGQPNSESCLYHVHYALGSVGYIKRYKHAWYINEDLIDFKRNNITEPMFV